MTVFVITMGVVYTLFTTTVGTTLASLVLKLSAGLRFRTTFKILGIHYFSVMIVPFVALSGLMTGDWRPETGRTLRSSVQP